VQAAREHIYRPPIGVVGVFARAGWADGNIEPWDFTDIDGTVSGGLSITGKRWNRPDDTVGIGGPSTPYRASTRRF